LGVTSDQEAHPVSIRTASLLQRERHYEPGLFQIAGRFGGSVDAEGSESIFKVGRSTSVQGLPLEALEQGSPKAFLALKRPPDTDDPTEEEIHAEV
jgi:hypothetical protein